MPNMVSINGVSVDLDDPCAVAAELKKVELLVASGGGVVRTRFGNDEVQWTVANLNKLQALIARYDGACAVRSGTRLRYAKRLRFVGGCR